MKQRAKLKTWNEKREISSQTIAGVFIDGEKVSEYNRPFTVCGISVSWSVIEYATAVHEGKKKPAGITRDEAFCEACSEIYSREEKRLTDYNASRGLNKEGEPLNNQKGELKAMKHTNFKAYLEDVRQIRDKAAQMYMQNVEAMEAEKKKWSDFQRSDHTERQAAIARGEFYQAENEYKEAQRAIMNDASEKIAAVRKELQEHTTAFYRADPSSIDPAALTLLNSGIMTTAELEHMANPNRSNVTMLRLIGAEAGKRIDAKRASGSRDQDKELLALYYGLKGMGNGEKEMKIFDQAAEWAIKSVDANAAANATHKESYDGIFNSYCEAMGSMAVKPAEDAQGQE